MISTILIPAATQPPLWCLGPSTTTPTPGSGRSAADIMSQLFSSELDFCWSILRSYMYVALVFVCWTEPELSDHLLSCLKVNCHLCFFSVQPTFGQPVTYFQHCCWSFDDDGPVNGDDDNFTVRSLSWWFCSKGFGFCLSEPPRRNYLEKEQKKVAKEQHQ